MTYQLPQDDAGIIAEAQNFLNAVSLSPADFGLTVAQVTALDTDLNNAHNAVNAQAAAKNAYSTATAEKKMLMDLFETLFRQLRRIVQANPTTTDVTRAQLHLATGAADPSVGVTHAAEFQAAPLLLVTQSGVHGHRISFYMEGSDSNSTRKPARALGCKIYLKIDGAPSTISTITR